MWPFFWTRYFVLHSNFRGDTFSGILKDTPLQLGTLGFGSHSPGRLVLGMEMVWRFACINRLGRFWWEILAPFQAHYISISKSGFLLIFQCCKPEIWTCRFFLRGKEESSEKKKKKNRFFLKHVDSTETTAPFKGAVCLAHDIFGLNFVIQDQQINFGHSTRVWKIFLCGTFCLDFLDRWCSGCVRRWFVFILRP